MERLILNSIRIEKPVVAEGEDLVKISGYGCHFGKVNGNGEIVNEKSFSRFFNEIKERGLMPIFTYNHDSGQQIGGWDSITADEVGLVCEGHLNKKIPFVRDYILPLMESGDLNHLSTEGWGYDCQQTKEGLLIHDFELFAISLVPFPADFEARANIVNSKNGPKEETLKPFLYI